MAFFANLVGRLSMDSTAFDRNSRRASQSMYHMRRRSLALQGTIIKLGAAFFAARGVIRGLSAVTREAASFSLGMARIHTMLDEGTARFLPRYREEIQKMAIEFGESTASLQDATYSILSGSLAAGKAMQFLRANVIAAKGGFTSTAIATKASIGILNAYGMKAREVMKINDILAMSVYRGQITYEELASEIGKVSSLAAILGVDFEALAAIISTITRAGISAEIAITGVKNILNKFKTPTKEARKAAAELGFELNANSIKGAGLINVMDKLKNANAAQLDALMPSIRGLVGFAAALKNSTGLAADYKLMINSAGRSLQTYNKVQDEVALKMAKMSERWKAYKRQIGTEVIPAVSDLMDEFEELHEANVQFINEQLGGLAEMLSGFESLRTVVRLLTEDYEKLSDVTPGWLKAFALPAEKMKKLTEMHPMIKLWKWEASLLPGTRKSQPELPEGKLDISISKAKELAEMRARARQYRTLQEGTESWLEQPSDFLVERMQKINEEIVDDTKDMNKNTQVSWDIRKRLLEDEYETYKVVLKDKLDDVEAWWDEVQKIFEQEKAIARGSIFEGFAAGIAKRHDELMTLGKLGEKLGETLEEGLVNSLTDAVFEAKNLGDAMREVGLSMAKMAFQWGMQQAVSGGLMALTGIVAHGGATVGGGMQVKRSMPGAEFIGATRFHAGGEVPAWLQPGERVTSKQQAAGNDRLLGELVSLTRRLVAKDTAPTVAVVQSEEQILDVMRSRAGEEAIIRAQQRME
jgi:TP901 family phage tail tape measure protein